MAVCETTEYNRKKCKAEDRECPEYKTKGKKFQKQEAECRV